MDIDRQTEKVSKKNLITQQLRLPGSQASASEALQHLSRQLPKIEWNREEQNRIDEIELKT